MNNLQIFVDFDGTISINDVTDEIFKIFGDHQKFITAFLNKEITIFDYWREFVRILPNNLDEYLMEFYKEQPIDPYFKEFVNYCNNLNIPITIVTDNFDFLIKKYFEFNQMEELHFFSNTLLIENDKFVPEFTYANEGCGGFSAVCKRNIVLENTTDDQICIYIGDGFSDYAAAEVSDIIFAKSTLAKFCAENRLPHHNWKTFFDIRRILEKYISEKSFRKRHQATIQRKWTYEKE